VSIGKKRPSSCAAIRVAGDRGLRGQGVHRLGARDARHGLHREGGDAGRGEVLGDLAVGQRLQVGDQRRPALHAADLLGGRRLDLGDYVAGESRAGLELRAGLGQRLVKDVGVGACAGLDDDLDPSGGQLLDHLRDDGDARLAGQGLLWN
jgi:hypothetical protein